MNAEGREVAVAERTAQPLDELMLAMDVVDTLRHRELVLQRELQADDRDQRLLERLRDIYESQGIAVTDDELRLPHRGALRPPARRWTSPGHWPT